MKMVKSLLLGSAAGLVAIAGAQAADLPVKAKPVQYVKICSLYGAGFYYIPGTDTCMKLGGWVRVEIGLNGANSGAVFNNGGGGRDTRIDNSYASMRSRFVITTDTRTQTEYGTLRTYTRAGMQASYQDYNQGGTYFERAFIQLGGFTFGKTQSFFDFMGGAFSYSGYYGGYSNTGAGGTNLFAYTASFGNGLSATISAEDPTIRYGVVWDWFATPLVVGSNPGPFSLTSSSYPGGGVTGIGNQRAQVPDLVANFRVDQAWGSAQIAGALHQLRAGFYDVNTNPALGAPADAWGWAIAGGVSVNLPWAKGDKAFVEATYTQGAMCYVGMCANGTQDAYDRWTSTSFAMAWAFDSVFNRGTAGVAVPSQQLTEAWAITGGVEHYWKPNLRTSLYGAYTSVNYNAAATALFCTSAVTGVFATSATQRAGCNPDFSEWAIGSKTVWNPAPGLDVGLEVLYTDLHTNNTGSVTTTAAFGGRPIGVYSFAGDMGVLQGLFRIQRNFWP